MTRVKILPHELKGLGADAEARIAAELRKPLTDRKPRAKRGTGATSRRKLAAAGVLRQIQSFPGSLVMPWPPSVNAYWRSITVLGRSRVVLSREARDYKADVRCLATDAGLCPTADQVSLSVIFHEPDRRRRDIDNLLKAVLDSLTGILWDDDSQVRRIETEFRERVEGGAVVVRAKPLEGGAR